MVRNLNAAIILMLTDRKQGAIGFRDGGKGSGLPETFFWKIWTDLQKWMGILM